MGLQMRIRHQEAMRRFGVTQMHIAICSAFLGQEGGPDRGLPVSTSALICSAPSVDLYLVQRHITVEPMEPPE
jgi:hypothetical protein